MTELLTVQGVAHGPRSGRLGSCTNNPSKAIQVQVQVNLYLYIFPKAKEDQATDLWRPTVRGSAKM